jgi:dTDP-glucose 4,6-dehydratase
MIWIAVTFVSIALFAMTTLIGFPEIPRSVILIASTVSFLIQSSLRVIYRMNWISRNVLIYGAGVAGRQLAEQLLKMKDKYKLIGFLDDNKIKINSRVFGEKVFGTIDEIETICVNNRPELIIVAVSDLNLDKLQFLREFTKARDIELRIIPAAQKIISGEVSLQDTFSIDDINILNRQELQTFSKQVEDFYSTKRVLVTGAGGSIGSELVKQVKQTGCSEIYLLDRDENRLLETLIQIDNQSSLADDKVYLADIRDGKNLLEIIAQIKPDVIFHAAALSTFPRLRDFLMRH